VWPFTEPEVDEYEGAERRRRLAFNKTLSGSRIYIEHTFGLLKSRFQSLRDFGRHEDVNEIYQVIEALMVVHNICIDWNDHPLDAMDEDWVADMRAGAGDDGYDAEVISYGNVFYGEEGVVADYETDEWHKEEGRKKRDAILNKHFPVELY
jgi:DDE superfamily endonuclease